MVYRAVCYCLDVARSKRSGEARVIDNELRGGLVTLWLEHTGWPEYAFRLTYTSAGMMVGFEMADRRATPSSEGVLPDLPLDTEDWHPPPAFVGLRRLRDAPIGDLDRAARQQITDTFGRLGDDMLDAFKNPGRPGRRGRDDGFYAALASRYVALLGSGHPVVDLAKEFGQEPPRVRNWLHEARRRGVLSHPTPGKAGGDLTQKGRDLL